MRSRRSRHSFKRKAAAGAGIVITISALVAIVLLLMPHAIQYLESKPKDGKTDEEVAENVSAIDWNYWKGINPDIVAWITIPGTPIDHPVVQARKSDPTYYLNHDVYRKRNPYGCLYIDSESSIESANVIIFGHNMHGGNTAMFGSLTKYLDAGFIKRHRKVIIQTPDKVYDVEVRAANMVKPYGYNKQTDFDSVEELQDYYLSMWEKSKTKTSHPNGQDVEKLFTLITCGYTGATRTIVYVT